MLHLIAWYFNILYIEISFIEINPSKFKRQDKIQYWQHNKQQPLVYKMIITAVLLAIKLFNLLNIIVNYFFKVKTCPEVLLKKFYFDVSPEIRHTITYFLERL